MHDRPLSVLAIARPPDRRCSASYRVPASGFWSKARGPCAPLGRCSPIGVSRKRAAYFTFYNEGRPHSALDGRTPDMVYFGARPHREAA
jgi:hypothetical protein